MNKTRDYISVYLRNHEEGPSCYYRIMQYINDIDGKDYKINDALPLSLFRLNMDCKFKPIKKMIQAVLYVVILINRFLQLLYDYYNKPRIVVIQREVYPRKLPEFFRGLYEVVLRESVVIWDFDDAIDESGEISIQEWKLLSLYSSRIIATSEHLLNKVTTDKVEKIKLPTTDGFCNNLELSQYYSERKMKYDKNFRLVWVGTHTNLKNIVDIIPNIQKAGKRLRTQGKRLELVIVCNSDNPIFYEKNDDLKIIYQRWTRADAENAILGAHLGLMPLPNDEWAKGKGGFKLIQYMSTGIPVLGAAVGINNDIISKDVGKLIYNDSEWENAIIEYAIDKEKWSLSGKKALDRYQDKYSFEHNRGIWKTLLEKNKYYSQ